MYLVIPKDTKPFFTAWFDEENCYAPGMRVFDLRKFKVYEGSEWKDVEVDHL